MTGWVTSLDIFVHPRSAVDLLRMTEDSRLASGRKAGSSDLSGHWVRDIGGGDLRNRASRIPVRRKRQLEENRTRICELLVGLGEEEIVGVDGESVGPLELHVRTRRRPSCGGCDGAVWSKRTRPVGLVDLRAFARPERLIWHKTRWRCPAAGSAVASFTRSLRRSRRREQR